LVVRTQNIIFAMLSANPFDIMTNAEGGKVTIDTKGEQSFADLFDLGGLFQLLKREGMIWSAIVIVILLISMFFVNRSDKLAEKKADIMHKLLIVFLMSSALFLLGAIVYIFDEALQL